MIYTRKQLEAMKPAELNAVVAEVVMGWRRGCFLEATAGWWVGSDAAGLQRRMIHDWEPATDARDWWEVVERMRERGFRFELWDAKDKCEANFGDDSDAWTMHVAKTMGVAVSIAATLAVQGATG